MKRSQTTLFMSTAYNSLAGGGILMWEKLIRNQFGENRFTEPEKFFLHNEMQKFHFLVALTFFCFLFVQLICCLLICRDYSESSGNAIA